MRGIIIVYLFLILCNLFHEFPSRLGNLHSIPVSEEWYFNDRKIVFFAQFITQVAYAVVGLCAVVIFVVFNVVSRTEDDMIVYMSLINMRGNNIRIFSF